MIQRKGRGILLTLTAAGLLFIFPSEGNAFWIFSRLFGKSEDKALVESKAALNHVSSTESGLSSEGSSSEPLTLEDTLLEAARNNPQIAAARARWEAAKRRVPQAWALPDPMAGVDLMGEMTETRVGPQENRFMVSQEIPFPLKLWERRKMAKAGAEAAKERYRAVERDILNQVRITYYELYEVDASIAVIEEVQQLLKSLESVAGSRYANLAGGQRDAAKAQAEVSLILQDLLRLRQRRASLEALMNRLLDRSPLDPIPLVKRPDVPVLERTLPEILTLASRYRQEIQEMEAMLERERKGKRLAQYQYIPDVEVGFSYTQVGGGTTNSPEDGKDSWMIPLRFNIPLWQNRIIPSIQEAQKEVEAASAMLEEARNETFYQVRDAYVRYTSSAEIAQLYETAVIPQARLALSSDQAGYQSNTVDFLNVLDSERVYLNAQIGFIQTLSQALKSYADLERAAGLDLHQEKEEGSE